MKQDWFEMRDIRKRRLADAVWIPLRAAVKDEAGRYGHTGYREEFVGQGSVAFPLTEVNKAEALSWSDIGLIHGQSSYAFKNSYKPADVYQFHEETDLGIALVLEQSFGGAEPHVWHLHQDLVIALGLLREGDVWVCPAENYVDVARLTHNRDNSEASIEIRAEFLRDYLAARQMALKISTYRSRREVVEVASHIKWADARLEETSDGGRFEGRVFAIHEGGDPFGAKTAVFHVWRTDVDAEIDVPTFTDASDSNTGSRSWEIEREDRKLFHIEGEFRRDEWIQPADASPRVRGDKLPATCSFIVDASGERQSADELDNEDIGRWLWFEPGVIGALETRRGGSLRWYTRDTGTVAASYGHGMHFGINAKGLINVYAYDVARLPVWQQRIWMGFNISPDGKVSSELLSAQMKSTPARTLAPEAFLERALVRLNEVFRERWRAPLLLGHQDTREILRKANRFRSSDHASLLALAKDLARLTADNIDVALLHAIVPLAKKERRGSLKSLERVLATIVFADEAKRAMAPLVGVYNLRVGDAHLASSQIDEGFDLVGIDRSGTPLQQGFQLLCATVGTLVAIANIIETALSVASIEKK